MTYTSLFFSCTLLGFIIPGISHLKLCGEDLTVSEKILDYVLVRFNI